MAVAAMEPGLVRIGQVAELVGLSRAKVYQLIAAGELGPVIKIGSASRMRLTDVRVWIDKQADLARSRSARRGPMESRRQVTTSDTNEGTYA